MKEVNPPEDSERPILERPLADESASADPDAEFVARVKAGETDAFEELVRRHGQRVYWLENPEDLYSREELRRLVEMEVMKLPSKYRVALILRDLEELSTEEAANALGLTIPGLKARVLRGRLMLRESMVSYFAKSGAGVNV